jgi:hypothetical protein
MQYRYTLGSQNAYLPASDVLVMDMQGMVTDDSLGRTPIYSCNWSYQTAAGGAPWFYAMDESQAVALGVEYNSKYTDSWVELKTPLAQDKSWTFVSKGETVKATVAKYGSSAQVSGNTYDDVVVVNYQGTNGTTGTEWFARGVGTIYYHVVRPNNVLIIEQFQSMAQK